MRKCVYIVEMKDYGKLKTLLAQNPYEKDSFPVVGYVLKESKPLGLKGGSYVVYFKAEDEAVLLKLEAQLKTLATAKALDGEEKEKIISQIEAEEDAAAAGIGDIFG